MVAATVLKIQEKKTQKGTPYAIIKFSDLGGIFELFVFSDVFALSADNIKESKSVIITISKIFNETDNRMRINVKKIISLDELLNKPINNLKIKIKDFNNFNLLSKILDNKGEVEVSFEVLQNNKIFTLKLKNKRFVDKKILNLIKNQGISASIF